MSPQFALGDCEIGGWLNTRHYLDMMVKVLIPVVGI